MIKEITPPIERQFEITLAEKDLAILVHVLGQISCAKVHALTNVSTHDYNVFLDKVFDPLYRFVSENDLKLKI